MVEDIVLTIKMTCPSCNKTFDYKYYEGSTQIHRHSKGIYFDKLCRICFDQEVSKHFYQTMTG